jgi:hypothetical protein
LTSLKNIPLILANMLESINQGIIYPLWTVISTRLIVDIEYVQGEILFFSWPLMLWLGRGTAVDEYLESLA